MSVVALLIVQLVDPIRIAAVFLGMWFVWSTYEGKHRVVAVTFMLLVIAGAMSVVMGFMRGGSDSVEWFLVRTMVGLFSNAIIAALAIGAMRLFKGKKKIAG